MRNSTRKRSTKSHGNLICRTDTLNPDVTDMGSAGDAVVCINIIKQGWFSFADMQPDKVLMSILNSIEIKSQV